VSDWRVLVVEDDPAVARYHDLLVSQTPGFTVVGIADTAEAAANMLDRARPDLILLDLALPGRDGLALLRQLRGRRDPVEAITVSANRNATAVRECAHLGVVDYLVKPFPPDRLRQALRLFTNRMAAASRASDLEQAQVDMLMASGRIPRRAVPRGLDAKRVEEVRIALRAADRPVAAQDIAARLAISRVTVRRYLEYLAATGEAQTVSLPGTTGRPRNGYWLRKAAAAPARGTSVHPR
jgi:response regulator of citrate/malate metabolism